MTTIRPLGEIMEVLERAGYKTTYAYDDLIFIEHSPFLLRFDSVKTSLLYFYSHADTPDDEQAALFTTVENALNKSMCTLINQGSFSMDTSSSDENTIDVTFYDKRADRYGTM